MGFFVEENCIVEALFFWEEGGLSWSWLNKDSFLCGGFGQ